MQYEPGIQFVGFVEVTYHGTCVAGFSRKPSDILKLVPGP